MYHEKGWMLVQRLSHEVKQIFIDSIEDPDFDNATTDEERDTAFGAFMDRINPDVCAFLWDALYEASTKQALGCTTAAGRTVLLDSWITHAVTTSSSGFYFDLFDGVIKPELFSQEKVVQPLLGLPLVVREADARKIIAKLEKTALSAEKLRSDEKYVREIVKAFDDSRPVTKAWVRENITGRIKVAEFDAIWAEAARQRPGLSRSGPRGPRRTAK